MRLATVFLLASLVSCFEDQSEESKDRVAIMKEDGNVKTTRIVYIKNFKGTLPSRIMFDDGSCWSFVKVGPPWSVLHVYENSFSLEAPASALGIPRLDIDTEEQNNIKIGLAYSPSHPGVSPQRYRELLEQGLATEFKEISVAPFKAIQTGSKGPSKSSRTNLVDFERNIVCRLSPLTVGNPYLFCQHYNAKRVFTYRLPAAALEQLDSHLNGLTEVLDGLACSNGEGAND